MISLAYNISAQIKRNLERIDKLNSKLAVAPIPRNIELMLQWEAIINRIYWSLILDNKPITKPDLSRLFLSLNEKKGLQKEKRQALAYKDSYDEIWNTWYVTQKEVTPKTIEDLSKLLSPYTQLEIMSPARKSLSQILNYLQTGSDNPVLKAGIVHIQLRSILETTSFKDSLPRHAGLLFLYKYGKNFRNLLVLEEVIKKDLIGFEKAIQSTLERRNMTVWLEYYTHIIATQLNKALEQATERSRALPKFATLSSLSERQKAILSFLESPDQSITNRQIQKKFKISQVTASRDLTKLTTLGLIFAKGSGRSTSYTR